MERPLLILDLDETLVHATTNPPNDRFSFEVANYFVYVRPHVQSFLDSVSCFYDLAVWTASTESYASEIVASVIGDRELQFLWGRSRCTQKFDEIHYEQFWLKDLRKVKRQGWQLERVLMIDDTPKKLTRNYGNLVRVSAWEGNPNDNELLDLAKYLEWLHAHENFRTIEKRGWRSRQLT